MIKVERCLQTAIIYPWNVVDNLILISNTYTWQGAINFIPRIRTHYCDIYSNCICDDNDVCAWFFNAPNQFCNMYCTYQMTSLCLMILYLIFTNYTNLTNLYLIYKHNYTTYMHDNTDYENMLRVSNKVCRLNEIWPIYFTLGVCQNSRDDRYDLGADSLPNMVFPLIHSPLIWKYQNKYTYASFVLQWNSIFILYLFLNL